MEHSPPPGIKEQLRAMMAEEQPKRNRPSWQANCACLIAPALTILSGMWFYMVLLLLAAAIVSVLMLKQPSRRTRQMGASLLVGTGLTLLYTFIAVAHGY
jgi:hypothetical protein